MSDQNTIAFNTMLWLGGIITTLSCAIIGFDETKEMNLATKLKQRTNASLRSIRDNQRRAEQKVKRQEDAFRKSAIAYFKNTEFKKVRRSLTKSARTGSSCIEFYHEGYSEIKEFIKKFAAKNGLTYEDTSYWQEARSGDPDSGEGACDGHAVSRTKLSW